MAALLGRQEKSPSAALCHGEKQLRWIKHHSSIQLSVHPTIRSSNYPSIYPSIHLSVRLPIGPFNYPSTHLSVHPLTPCGRSTFHM